MAATATPSDEQVHKVPLKVLVDKVKKKVLFAEARKDFVDVILSFLTLPLGTIARLVAKESNIPAVKVGSLSSLYESVSHLEGEYLWTQTCKEMLLHPRNSMADYCLQLKLNIDDTDPTKYFLCENWYCYRKESGSLLSIFRNQRCSCRKVMNMEMAPGNLTLENGFVNETASFIICDDLSVLPNVLGTSMNRLRKLGIKDMDAIEQKTVYISKREVVDLLKLSFLSNTPFTDFIFERKPCVDNFKRIKRSRLEIGDESTDEGRKMVVKVLVRKSDSKILFAESEEDFADLVFSFLTLPLGGVLHMLEGRSSLSCIDNLYRSVSELNPDRYLRSQGLKDKLSNPKCAPKFALGDQILPIGEVSLPVYYCHTYLDNRQNCFALATKPNPFFIIGYRYFRSAQLDIVDPKSFIGDSPKHGVYAKGPSMYMVTDDLVVTPMSSVSCVSYLNTSKVPFFDLEERVISIGVQEALSILKASLTSTSALTNGLKEFTKSIKRET